MKKASQHQPDRNVVFPADCSALFQGGQPRSGWRGCAGSAKRKFFLQRTKTKISLEAHLSPSRRPAALECTPPSPLRVNAWPGGVCVRSFTVLRPGGSFPCRDSAHFFNLSARRLTCTAHVVHVFSPRRRPPILRQVVGGPEHTIT